MEALAVLRSRNFQRLLLGANLSQAGAQATRIALLLYVVQSQGRVPDLALLVVMETVPGAIVAPFAGALVDRSCKQALMLGANVGRIGLLALLIAHPDYWMMCVVAGCQSMLLVLFQPARAAAIPLVVAESELARANGLDQSASDLMLVVAPVLGAEILMQLGLQATLLAETILLLASTGLIARIRIDPAPGRAAGFPASTIVADVRDGLRYVGRNRLLLHLMTMFFIGVLCNAMWVPLAPFIISDLGAPPRILGWQVGTVGLGAAFGGLVAPALVDRYGKGSVLLFGLMAEGISISLYALAPSAALSTFTVFIWGMIVPVTMVPLYSLLQTSIDGRLHGRIFALVRQIENCAVIVAMPLAGFLNGFAGAGWTLFTMGLFYAIFVAACSVSLQGRVLKGIR